MKDQNTLITLLKQYDAQSMPFLDAKNILLEKGYSNEEISQALYQFSYDGKPNITKKDQLVTKLFTQNPKDAQMVADYLSNNHKDNSAINASINYAASQLAVGHQAKSHYSYKFAQDIDYPFFTVISLTILAIGLLFIYNLPKYTVFIPWVVISLFWLAKIVFNNIRK